MAEAIGAFYAIETVLEGTAAGAFAVSGSTVPLHAYFRKIVGAPSKVAATRGSTSEIIKNKLYIIGGETANEGEANGIHTLTFPADFGSSRTNGNTSVELDYELKEPEFRSEERPLQAHNKHLEENVDIPKDHSHHQAWSRTKHSSVSCDDRIYVIGGVSHAGLTLRRSNTQHIIPLDTILAFDTLRTSYSVIPVDKSKCSEGIPEPRYSTSVTVSPNPDPLPAITAGGPAAGLHGTIFVHGGFDNNGLPLHDTWTLDLETRAWHKLPTIVEEALRDSSKPGRIAYVDGRLWYVNGGTVMYLELAERLPQGDDDIPPVVDTQSNGRVGSGQWQVVFPLPEADPAVPSEAKPPAKKDTDSSNTAEPVPTGLTEHIQPITTGAGRQYLLSMSSADPQNMYLFQIPSIPKTAASIKDTIRDEASHAISALSDSWKSGKHEWSKVEVIQANKEDGELDRPDMKLADFASAAWFEYGDKFVIWGGEVNGAEPKNEGWIVHLD